MLRLFMRFPGGFPKALTLSYDDGVEQDIRLMEILDKNGLKCTFNINGGVVVPEDKVYEPGTIHRRMSQPRMIELYKNSGHEVAVHAYTHPWLETLPTVAVAQEIIEDRKALEAMFERPIRGMAYPMGTFSDAVVDVLKVAGIAYARTTQVTRNFKIPSDWLRLAATCKHTDPDLMNMAEKFVTRKADNHAQLFYLWGHSYEFEADDNWDVIERFAEYTGGKEDIWYATNIEIYDYIEAYNRLQWSADLSMVHNPSAISVWVKKAEHGSSKSVTAEIKPGETFKF